MSMEEALHQLLAVLTQPSSTGEGSVAQDSSRGSLVSRSTRTSLPGSLLSVSGTLVSSLASSAALRDWLKLLILGGTIETCRRTLFWLYRQAVNAVMITATFEQDDDCYGACRTHTLVLR